MTINRIYSAIVILYIMEEGALKSLEIRLQKQIENARKSVVKNPSYAVDILTNIVARNPACLDAHVRSYVRLSSEPLRAKLRVWADYFPR